MLILIKVRIKKNKNSQYFSLYRCDCGTEKEIMDSSVKRGNTKSCGCLLRENGRKTAKLNTTHGMRYTKEYECWKSMKQRCSNPNKDGYKNYGGRGIKVCDRWLNSFENFYADMGPKPVGHSIDRINNDGNYEPKNCKWSSNSDQAYNRRPKRKK